MANHLLCVEDLVTMYPINGIYYRAVDKVSFIVNPKETVAIVGESGCGKSSIARTLIGEYNNRNDVKVQGKIIFNGKNLLTLNQRQLQSIRGKRISMITQNSLNSLDPIMKIGQQIEEVILSHNSISKKQLDEKVIDLLYKVQLPNPETTKNLYPFELSGGMKQRVIIAMAIANSPDLLIADEPTTALDVSTQEEILDLLIELQQSLNIGIVLISHDLAVVSHFSHKILIMYASEIVEEANTADLFANPLHPYTKSLLKASPTNIDPNERLYNIEGRMPSLDEIPSSGCRIAQRISSLENFSHESNPQLKEVYENHYVRCSCWKDFNI